MVFYDHALIGNFNLNWKKHKRYKVAGDFVSPVLPDKNPCSPETLPPNVNEEGEIFRRISRLGNEFSRSKLADFVRRFGLLKDNSSLSKERVSFIESEAKEFFNLASLYHQVHEKNHHELQRRITYKPLPAWVYGDGKQYEKAYIDGQPGWDTPIMPKTKERLEIDAFLFLASVIEKQIQNVTLTFIKKVKGKIEEGYKVVPAFNVNSPLEFAYLEFFLAISRNAEVVECKGCGCYFPKDSRRAEAKYCCNSCRSNA